MMLIGELLELLPQLKIKDNADHVGLSQQPDVLKVSQKSLMEDYNHSQNNN